jgi:hypothetical protein
VLLLELLATRSPKSHPAASPRSQLVAIAPRMTAMQCYSNLFYSIRFLTPCPVLSLSLRFQAFFSSIGLPQLSLQDQVEVSVD